jgi:putative flippase GtrA
MSDQHSKRLISEFLGLSKFASVGIIATLAHVAVFSALMETTKSYATGANLFAFLVALAVSFLGNAKWTFRAAGAPISRLGGYALLATGGFLLNGLFAFVITDVSSYPYTYVLMPMIFVTPLATYLGARMWVFKEQLDLGN